MFSMDQELRLPEDYRHHKVLNIPKDFSFFWHQTICARIALGESGPVKAIHIFQCSDDQPLPKTKMLLCDDLYFYTLIPRLFSDSYQAST